ncbi:Spo0B C-terminal domain-containing protein [Niallia sp. NCCP-28]|uniref:Spo0B C-terminal domain-containing protein n=1 Tax=Niallia sp. NCCP-28 TaxID=2934712 RepID=UPI00208676FB|nr:Spo0B C-terminal domain-containing protein [Niallia sp. NCCP-28]GKU81425.1 sporulation protein [Niallia sp. NCCP-28]
MKKDWKNIDFLRHVRHDWLNKVQLIKGNLALNKEERVKEIIDDIIREAQQEARLSNLELPDFALLLLTLNWESYCFHLEYEVLNDEKCQYIEDAVLTKWTAMLFNVLDKSAKSFYENHLSVSIAPESNGIRLFFDFSGIITDRALIDDFLHAKSPKSIKVEIHALMDEEIALEVFVENESASG